MDGFLDVNLIGRKNTDIKLRYYCPPVRVLYHFDYLSIFSRTHKQIKQIIRELNKTDYRGARMTILSGRDHSCVHDKVLKMKNRNEGCRELNDKSKGGMCSYLSNVKSKLSTHHAVNAFRPSHQRGTAWDVEDLVAVGKKIRACPYYAARELKAKAHIVFCPYNYLIGE